MERGRFDTGRVARLNDAGRLVELRPGQLLTQVAGVGQGMTCVDLGCGTGVFTLPMAGIVGAGGRVYAVDSSSEMLDFVASQATGSQVTLVQADASRTGLADESAEVCLVALVLHEVAFPSLLLAEAYRLLTPAGLVVMVEWRMESTGGPPPEVKIGSEKARELLRLAGFADGEYLNWSKNHYVATGKKPH